MFHHRLSLPVPSFTSVRPSPFDLLASLCRNADVEVETEAAANR